MASCVTVSQWPIGTRWSTASAIQERHTAARVHDVWSLARSTSTSSRPCFVRSRAAFAAVQTGLMSGLDEGCMDLSFHLQHAVACCQCRALLSPQQQQPGSSQQLGINRMI